MMVKSSTSFISSYLDDVVADLYYLYSCISTNSMYFSMLSINFLLGSHHVLLPSLNEKRVFNLAMDISF